MADQIQPTPRSTILGLFSDIVNLPLQYMSSPQRTQQMQGTAQFLYGTGIPKTLERMSYGESLFSGAGGLGGTTRMRPETADALMNVAPFAPMASRTIGRVARSADSLPIGMAIKDVKFPQQAALDLAQQRAALPVEQGGLGLPINNTATDRAKAMGFDTDVFHGTRADILIFDPTKPVFTTPATDIADFYARGTNANVMPLKLRGKEIQVSDITQEGSGKFAENLAKIRHL